MPDSGTEDESHTVSTDECAPESATDSLNSLIESPDTTDCTDCTDCAIDNVECNKTCVVECATEQCYENDKVKRSSYCCSTVGQCVWGVLLLLMSISGFLFTPLDIMLKEKLNMRPGFPPYEWWADPPDEVKLRMYVFNVTNHDRFIQGLDEKLNVEEIGPIVYLEKLLHYNISFNENSTMTYTAKRYPIFLPDDNTIDLNASLVVPNLAVLGFSSYLHDANYFIRSGFRMLVNTYGSDFFMNKTIYEYLWDYREPILDTSKSFVPGLVPVANMGMLARIYADFTDEVTVKIGPQWGHRNFFQIDRFRGQPQLPGYNPDECPDRIFGSTEGVMYQQHLTKQDVLLYWRKTVCKLMPLYFDSELIMDDVPVFRYNLSESAFERITNDTDCYDTVPSLPTGLSDASRCFFDFPMVASYPHFYTNEPRVDQYVTGMKPDREKHSSYVIVEPHTGTPFRSVARLQSNLRINDLSGFNREYDKFSNLVIPLFWAEYNQEGLPIHINKMIYFMIVILPPLSSAILAITLLLGIYLLTKQVYIHKLRNVSLDPMNNFKKDNLCSLTKNKMFSYEKEAFLKVPS